MALASISAKKNVTAEGNVNANDLDGSMNYLAEQITERYIQKIDVDFLEKRIAEKLHTTALELVRNIKNISPQQYDVQEVNVKTQEILDEGNESNLDFDEISSDIESENSKSNLEEEFQTDPDNNDLDAAMINQGTYGRLVIPDVGINVALNLVPSGEEQAVTDRKDSAAWIPWGRETLIADHKNQGFDAIKKCVPGKTKAYIGTTEGITTYILSLIHI